MRLLRFLLIFLMILALLILGLYLSGNQYLLKGVWATYLHGFKTASIGDARFFDLRKVPAGEEQKWPESGRAGKVHLSDRLREVLEENESVAFLVISKDSIVYEEYWDDYSETSHSNSFSMAKSITTLLVQIAIQQGRINSWNDKVIDYLPQIKGPYREELRLYHLSTMTAGLQWDENYTSPFDITAKAYYGPDVKSLMFEEVPVVRRPGKTYEYQSGATQLLGLVLMTATGKPISTYASEQLWKPIGAAEDAWWHTDEEGTELTYCCFNSNARDFARFGKLLLHHGNWNGQQILDSAFVQLATRPAAVEHYGYSFWIDHDDHLSYIYFMRGIHGQYVIVIPDRQLVIVRLGKKRSSKTDEHPADFHVIVEEVMKYFGK